MALSTWSWRRLGETAPVWPGAHEQLGATWSPESTNFAVFAPEATAMWVCLFDDEDGERRHQLTEQRFGVWHGAIPGVDVGTRYGYRADGPWAPQRGRRFNPAKLLLDPYARAITGRVGGRTELLSYDPDDPALPSGLDSAPHLPKSVVTIDEFDWGSDTHLRHRWRDTVIYELHAKGFTKLHPLVPEHQRGTYAGLGSEPVTSYLRDLGVTAVELLPVHHFLDEPDVKDRGLGNYWGYNSIGFFAPHAAYSSSGDRGEQVTEFKQMVKNLHAAGIEVILDVVYNHTAEGGTLGPTYSFRGLDDANFYKRAPGLSDSYWDVSGCGNTVDSQNLGALRLILDSLRYWATEMHVDGFRFDLAPALARTGHEVDRRSSFLGAIGQDPVLRHVKLIAEPWDISMDGYLVGSFPPPWVEWNDRYRDTVRDFWRGRSGGVREVASRLAGSSDLYADDGRSPYASVNFVTSHDGFTLRDLVSYDRKHNEANGEDNRDGTDGNHSWNHGVEGETDDLEVRSLRRRQAANLMVTLCLSSGAPMITAGDERGRTQRGNNNAYCQDNEISWVDWSDEDAWSDVHAVTRAALSLRKAHPALRQRHHFAGSPTIEGGPKDVAWMRPDGQEMSEGDWHDGNRTVLGMFVSGDPLRSPGPHGEQLRDRSFLLWLNSGDSTCPVQLPENDWVTQGEVVLSTDPAHAVGTEVRSGTVLELTPRSLVLLRQT
ncbi:MAG: GH13_11 / GH13 / GH13_10 / GH13_13 / CBM 48 / GH13_14 / GH13_32 [uncultured Nocardioidaceae bacterium]|uniref:GH13_11 / GH13 / GH13_10 / GH13_13 / CBM 48 / GH13_14 / GH13_32 n=1 Tax=uncultured Nocardioidaceae bacterium TaxID=253824 RepID=A0A6J4L986_9ACTN|nr:MAG: GH13_11 / GH13 / GH13_10 / GH13_13 / CBM 48 / GH13_14 / GH13_32 [uncultured Nocardioidaceae bacterium]